jgi:hypothetical protein
VSATWMSPSSSDMWGGYTLLLPIRAGNRNPKIICASLGWRGPLQGVPLTNWEILKRVFAELDLPSNVFAPKSIQARSPPTNRSLAFHPPQLLSLVGIGSTLPRRTGRSRLPSLITSRRLICYQCSSIPRSGSLWALNAKPPA